MSRATGRAKGNAIQQLLTAIDALCTDPAWGPIALSTPLDWDPVPLLIKRQRLMSLRKRFTTVSKP
jgi:hypothetical protein